MTAAKDAALDFEAVKVSSRQTKEGVFITLSIHPQDVPVDLIMAHVGTRYRAFLVQLGDDEKPVAGEDQAEGARAVMMAGTLAHNARFAAWMVKNEFANDPSEASVADGIRTYCAVASRAELRTNRAARRIFFNLVEDFERARW